jgi:Uma2 family endonuclease
MTAARVTKKPKSKPSANGHLPPVVSALPVRRFTIREYQKLLDVGVFQSGDPYELLNGVIVAKMPQNGPHASASSRLERRLNKLLPDEWLVRAGKPLTVPSSESVPEPDIAVVSGPEDKYDARHPAPNEVALLVEVSDSSLGRDTGEKLAVYARARVPQYWVMNVKERVIEVYTDPKGGKAPAYRTRTDYTGTDSVPVVVAGHALGSIAVKDLLPAGPNRTEGQ